MNNAPAITAPETVLEVSHLSKSLSGRPILFDISFSVKAGEIFGFVGPNGSGKTTTIKLILGLLRIDYGEIKISGKSLASDFEGAIAEVGGIIENPELYKYLTGRQNLDLFRRMYRDVPESRIEEVAETVGMRDRLDDKLGKYSLGMRQRIGVAQAILHKPKLLILDEPTNGLDPAGIKDLRRILCDLAQKENVAVLVSSHMLAELEQMCTTVGMIDRGRLVDIRTIEEVRSVGDELSKFTVDTDSTASAIKIAEGMLPEPIECAYENGILTVRTARERIPAFVRALTGAGIGIYGITPVQKSLEDAFIEKMETVQRLENK